MIPAGYHVWRLSEGGDQNFGLSCTQEGLFLGRTALVEQCDRGPDIRELTGGSEAARNLFEHLRVGRTEHRSQPNVTVIQLPGKAGFLTFRYQSRSGDSAIDIDVPGVTVKQIHFP